MLYTFIYDDLSWEADDLEVTHRRVDSEHKEVFDGLNRRNIRQRFRQAIVDFLRQAEEIVRQTKHRRAGRERISYYKDQVDYSDMRFMPLTEFMRLVDESHRYERAMNIPVQKIFVSFMFVDTSEMDDGRIVYHGTYNSENATRLLGKYIADTLDANSTRKRPEYLAYDKQTPPSKCGGALPG